MGCQIVATGLWLYKKDTGSETDAVAVNVMAWKCLHWSLVAAAVVGYGVYGYKTI